MWLLPLFLGFCDDEIAVRHLPDSYPGEILYSGELTTVGAITRAPGYSPLYPVSGLSRPPAPVAAGRASSLLALPPRDKSRDPDCLSCTPARRPHVRPHHHPKRELSRPLAPPLLPLRCPLVQ